MAKPVIETSWNIWLVDDDGKMLSWVGMITDPGTAFSWFKKMDLDPGQYRVNNIPPQSGQTPNPLREVYALSATDIREGAPVEIRTFAQRGPAKAKRAPVKKTSQRMAKAPAKKVADTPETLRMKADAKKLLDQHKADEAAEQEAAKGARK